MGWVYLFDKEDGIIIIFWMFLDDDIFNMKLNYFVCYFFI